jgi:hypothetical protein
MVARPRRPPMEGAPLRLLFAQQAQAKRRGAAHSDG